MDPWSGGCYRVIGALATAFFGIWIWFCAETCCPESSWKANFAISDRWNRKLWLNYDFPQMMVSLIEQGSGKIIDDNEGNSDVFCICQKFDDFVKTVKCALQKMSTLVSATTTHMETGERPMLEELLQALASDLDFQAAAKTVSFLTVIFTYVRDGVLVQ